LFYCRLRRRVGLRRSGIAGLIQGAYPILGTNALQLVFFVCGYLVAISIKSG
jgi:hypothetical protein